jgi:pyruvate/2-oxoglutarate dehydrogenase complex dihydrolipoamide dehydrogenase (E3) component
MNPAIAVSHMKHFDAIIIGTGQAGPSMAARFAGAGKTVAIIERYKFGGTFLTNSSMMDIDFLPEHFIIVGGSYVGLEFAQIYRRLGSEVTIVEMGPRLIGREDEDVSQAVREILEAEGIHIRLNAKCISLAKRDGGVAVGITCEEGPPEVAGTHVLLAVGRTPKHERLGTGPGWGCHRPLRLHNG